jgi:hypothetical protein
MGVPASDRGAGAESRHEAGAPEPALGVLLPCGAIILGSFAALGLTGARDGTPHFFGILGAASIAYIVAIVPLVARASTRTRQEGVPAASPRKRARRLPRGAIWAALALGLAMRLPLLLPMTGPGSDIFRYLWDARVQRAGLNPFVVVPGDPGYAALHSDDTRHMNNIRVPSPYPPAAQAFFRLVTSIRESPRAIRAALIVADTLTAVLLVWLLRMHGRSEWLALVYAWHPLSILEGGRNGHLDALGALLLVTAALGLRRTRGLGGALALAGAIAVKFLPLVLLPLFWRRVRLAHAAAGAGLLALLYVPYMGDGVIPVGSVAHVIDRFRFNGPIYAAVAAHAGPRGAAFLALALGLAVAAWFRRCRPTDGPEAWAWPLAITLMSAPLVYPWYLVWVVPFLWVRYTLPLLVWSLAILAVYIVWGFGPGATWAVPRWLLVAEYGAILLAGLAIRVLGTRERAP